MKPNPLLRLILGRPIPTDRAQAERLPKLLALPAFSSDALSSVAYGTQEILLQLSTAGAIAGLYTIPVSMAIVAVLVLVTISYRQTILAYPTGGGSYIVSKDNLSTSAGLVAAAALLTDYVLTVAVSIAAGVQQVTSFFPGLHPHTELLCLLAILVITLANLRGMKNSGALFAAPTYAFILMMAILIVTGLWREAPGSALQAAASPHSLPSVGWLLLLRAFASGCSALTGIEAISNGVPAFRPPASKNAAVTLTTMSILLGAMFLGTSLLSQRYGVLYMADSKESLLSVLAREAFHDHPLLRGALLASTTLILILAANTSFADFPRLSAILARDGFAPRQLTRLGDRLVYSNGIVLLGALASILILLFQGQTDRLIPLYAVGVFLAFTLSQAGMVRHWHRLRTKGWAHHAFLNGLGCVGTATVLVVVVVEKTTEGAWIVLLLIPALVMLFRSINRYYSAFDHWEAVDSLPGSETSYKLIVLVLFSRLGAGSRKAIAFGKTISADCRAVHVAVDESTSERIIREFKDAEPGLALEVLASPYRSLLQPVSDYVEQLRRSQPDSIITIVLPELIVRHWWERLLHHNSALLLRWSLLPHKNVVVVEVPFDPAASE